MPDAIGAELDSSLTAREWWASQRLRYNVGLFVAGALGFILYVIAVDRCIELHVPGDWEITLFTTIFQAFLYVVAMGIANLCYYVGPWSERVIRPIDVANYRKTAFRLGFWFSFLLPFAPAAALLVSCAFSHARS
jgi:hypothetical protein